MVAEAKGRLDVLAVDAGRIAVRTDAGVSLLTPEGAVLRRLTVKPEAAAVSGRQLAARTPSAVEI